MAKTIKILQDTTYDERFYKKGVEVLADDTLADAIIALGYAVEVADYGPVVGTASTGVVATEEPLDGVLRKTTLVLSDVTQAVAAAALAFGAELYTFPEGVVKVESVTADVTIAAPTETLTPDIGVGSVIASGAVSVLGGTATFEDIMDGFTGEAITSGGALSNNYVEAEAGVLDGAATAKKAHLNIAGLWTASEDVVYSGTVTLYWKYLGDY